MARFGRGSAVDLLRILLVASVVVPAGLLALDAWLGHRAVFLDAARDAARVCQVAGEHAAKVFNSHELVVSRVDDLLSDMTDEAIRSSERALHQVLAEMIVGLPQVGSFVVLDHTGHLLTATNVYPVPRNLTFADRDYFVSLKSGEVSTFLSKVQVSRLNGRVFFSFGRRLRDLQGEFRGVISIAVRPQFFSTFWATLAGGQDAPVTGQFVTLVRDDDTILASWPAREPAPKSAGRTFTEATRGAPAFGTFVNASLTDPAETNWRYTFCRVEGYPAYILVGRSGGALLRSWLSRLAVDAAVGVPGTAALWLLTWVALQRTRREEQAVTQMAAEMRRREVAEAALMQAQRMEAVGQLTGGVAHDFNNLLTIILGNFEIIGRDPARHDRVVRLAQAGMAAAHRGADITAKLLAFSRRRMVRPDIVDVNRLLGEFRPVLRQGITEAVILLFDLTPNLHAVALDPGQLEAAVLNLVANSRDAMGGVGTIRVETNNVRLGAEEALEVPDASPGEYVQVAVSDDGPGMEPAIAARVFEPFFTTKGSGRGTGLGLSQVYGFCKQAGGVARIRSAVGQGTTVEMLLPRAEQASQPKPDIAVTTPPVEPNGQVVLVVEDDEAVLEVAVASVMDLGFATRTATAAAEALEVIRSGARIDVLFSDVVLPGEQDGFELAAAARQARPALRIVLCSGYAGTEVAHTIPFHATVLSKPYTRDELAAALTS